MANAFVGNPWLDKRGEVQKEWEERKNKIYDPVGIQKRFISTMLSSGNIYPTGIDMIERAHEEVSQDNYMWLQSVLLQDLIDLSPDWKEKTQEIREAILWKIEEIGAKSLVFDRYPETNEDTREIKINPLLIRRLEIAAYKQQLLQIISWSHSYTYSKEKMITITREKLNKLWLTHKYLDSVIEKMEQENSTT